MELYYEKEVKSLNVNLTMSREDALVLVELLNQTENDYLTDLKVILQQELS
jgi:hypothetical protein